MPDNHRVFRPRGRLVFGFAVAVTSCAVAAMTWTSAWAAPFDTGDEVTPCRADQIAITASPTQGAVSHRAVTLVFSLAGGPGACTLVGYPDVASGAGGPPIRAEPTLRGYLGGLPASVDRPPTVTLSLTQQAQAIVEGVSVDASGNQCPTYTDLQVNPPDTVFVWSVPAAIAACHLQVHPLTAG